MYCMKFHPEQVLGLYNVIRYGNFYHRSSPAKNGDVPFEQMKPLGLTYLGLLALPYVNIMHVWSLEIVSFRNFNMFLTQLKTIR
jgi:hypothetical protein